MRKLNRADCRASRPFVKDFLGERKDALCENCTRRIQKNPLRILDCKVESCQKALQGAPATIDHLCPACADHFDIVTTTLKKQGVEFIVDKSLVRGLDYYTRTAWEIKTTTLGAQSAVAGGGRYDGLVQELGGPATPAIGFAIGFDRLVEVMAQLEIETPQPPLELFIIALGAAALEQAYHWSCELNQKGVRTEVDFRGKSLKSLMKRANKLNATHVLIAGENELKENQLILRNMETKDQRSLSIDTLVPELKNILKS